LPAREDEAMPLVINDELSIDDDDLLFSASRAGGPGGQNVNKVSSKVTLQLDLERARIPEEIKAKLTERLSARISREGVLQVTSQVSRSQAENREIAREKLAELIRGALVEKKARRRTKVPRRAKLARLEEKKASSEKKSLRRRIE
jgi:ribosome-associated protein